MHHISLLTAGKDRHYALGLLGALTRAGVRVDFVANDGMQSAPAAGHSLVNYLNLRRDQSREAGRLAKVGRVLAYYWRLIRYARGPSPELFHILWFNKFEWFDNTLLIRYYRMLGKRLVYTVHNVSTAARDQRGSRLNRWSLRFLYRNVDRIFVHSEGMKDELIRSYGASAERVTVLRFPVNDLTPRSRLSRLAARKKLGIGESERLALFFGNIAPYKGLEDAVRAVEILKNRWGETVRLLIAGPIKHSSDYWRQVSSLIHGLGIEGQVTDHARLIPEEEVGDYFRAADVLLLPYRRVYQSGVLFLSYNQGLPVVATDAGGMAECVVEGETGFICRAEDPESLAGAIRAYFGSSLYRDLERRQGSIIDYVCRNHSWETVAAEYCRAYRELTSAAKP